MSSLFPLFTLQIIEKWDLVVFDISRSGSSGVVFVLAFQTVNNYCTYVVLKEYWLHLSSYRGSTYNHMVILSVVVKLSFIWQKLERRKYMQGFWWQLLSECKLVTWLESSGSIAFINLDNGFALVLQKVTIVSLHFKNESVLKTAW